MGCFRAPTVYNCCFSICWACLSFPFSFINNNERASQNLSTKLSVKYPFSPSLSASASSWPRYAMQLQQNLPHPSPSSLCPYPSPAQVKREVFLEGRYVITHYFIRRILLSRDSQCAQWNDSWDVCGYYRLIPDNMLHFPWGISSNMHFPLSPFANIWSITYFPFLHFIWILIITILFSFEVFTLRWGLGQGERKKEGKRSIRRDPHGLVGGKKMLK